MKKESTSYGVEADDEIEEENEYFGIKKKLIDLEPPAKKPEVELFSAAFMKGKKQDCCEDAYFICNRGFGVSDGVSGWNDYGFSSSAFST